MSYISAVALEKSMDYGQFCPIAKAAEVLGEKWTILILRELLYGTSRFNDFQRAISGISPTMLTKRLRELEEHDLVEKHDHDYQLTRAGHELAPLMRQYAIWGMRWTRGAKLSKDELDVELLMWDMRRRIQPQFMPPAGCVLQVRFKDLKKQERNWWIVVSEGEVKLQNNEPEAKVDLLLQSDLRTLTGMWLGDVTLRAALAQQRLMLKGWPLLIRSIEQWLPLANYANVRPAQLAPVRS
jgi:DNA-binding HxlR family transcriptional regulator